LESCDLLFLSVVGRFKAGVTLSATPPVVLEWQPALHSVLCSPAMVARSVRLWYRRRIAMGIAALYHAK
jgi:hypothetical protein